MSRDIRPSYSKSRLNQAGKHVRDGNETEEDIAIIENWRAAHNHILNTWQANLRKRIGDEKIIFAQRLKRRVTVFDKLRREPTMALANMHDIAGCRLIFPDIKKLEKYRFDLHENKRFKHVLYKENEDPYNYINNPRSSGYRGIHDVYSYKALGKSGEPWNGLKVEIQYRTVYQHAWSTAVEIAGSLTGSHTKFDKGDEDHKEFFRLTSEIISRAHEDMKSCYPVLSDTEIVKKFKEVENKAHLLRHLGTLKNVTNIPTVEGKNLILKYIQVAENQYETDIFVYDSLPQATKEYFRLEKEISNNVDLVLVRSESNESIKNAYRNYFSDTGDFVHLVETGVKLLR